MHADLLYILHGEHYRICRLLTADQFADHCNKRYIKTSIAALERLEELGIFYPIARATDWPYEDEIRIVNDKGSYESLGPLGEHEQWTGKTRTEYSHFYFGRGDADEWLQAGHLWDPRTKPFVKWASYRGDHGISHMRSYYSPFQAYELLWRARFLRREIAAEFWVVDPDAYAKDVVRWARKMLAHAKDHFLRFDVGHLCQVLSNRYFPLTQTNQRYFDLAAPHDWDWYRFCERWEAQSVLSELSLEPSDIRSAWEMVLRDAKTCDPMEHWYELVSFVCTEKRDKLKGDALCAQTWYAMEHMLRLFYYDLTQEELPTPEGPVTNKFVPGIEKPSLVDPLAQLEEIANDFNINPRPTMILLVEGDSELKIVPNIVANLFGSSIKSLGIQLMALKGIGNFDGRKGYDPHGALIRFVDDYHSRRTIVFVIVDNEGRARKTAERLLKAKSHYQDRMVTRKEYVVIWNNNVEFDNFNDQEIAEAMTELAEGKHSFSASEIQEARASFGKPKGMRLEQVYEAHCGCSLEKPRLLASLVNRIFAGGLVSGSDEQRPIISVVAKVISLAHENRPQTAKAYREYLAKKGLYGEVLTPPASASDLASDDNNGG